MFTHSQIGNGQQAQRAGVPVRSAANAAASAAADMRAGLLRRALGRRNLRGNPRGGWPRRALLSAATLSACAALAVAPATAASASSGYPAAVHAASVNYGETAQFHCSTGEVTLDNMRLPNAELPVTWRAAVYLYTTAGWKYYKTMYTAAGYSSETIYNATQNVYDQQPMYASVPHGYYYAVLVYVVPNTNYAAHYDWGHISYAYEGSEGEGTSCVA